MENTQTNYYRVLTATIMYDKTLTPIEILLYAEITGLLGASGECFASNKYFSERFDRNETSISRILHKLQDKGYIKINIDRQKNNKRTIFLSEPLMKNHNTSYEKSEEPLMKNHNCYIYNNNRELITEFNKEKIYKKENLNTEVIEKTKTDYQEIYKTYTEKENLQERTLLSSEYNKVYTKYLKALKKYSHEEILQGVEHYLGYLKIVSKTGFQRQKKGIEPFFNQSMWVGENGKSWMELAKELLDKHKSSKSNYYTDENGIVRNN